MNTFSIIGVLFAGALSAQQSTVPAAQPNPSPSPSAIQTSANTTDKSVKDTEKKEPAAGTAQSPPDERSIQILSDTMGVDFKPYLKWMRDQVQQHWYPLIPSSALPPERKSGKVTLRFAILRDGRVTGLKIEETSGDEAFDHAAYGAITSSVPLPPLPKEFRGDYLLLRTRFLYNPGPESERPSQKPPEQPQEPKADFPKEPTQR